MFAHTNDLKTQVNQQFYSNPCFHGLLSSPDSASSRPSDSLCPNRPLTHPFPSPQATQATYHLLLTCSIYTVPCGPYLYLPLQACADFIRRPLRAPLNPTHASRLPPPCLKPLPIPGPTFSLRRPLNSYSIYLTETYQYPSWSRALLDLYLKLPYLLLPQSRALAHSIRP